MLLIYDLKLSFLILQGTYTAENVVLDYGDVNLPMMKKGKFRGKVNIAKEGKALCFVLTAELM